jgi:hypothetical protein
VRTCARAPRQVYAELAEDGYDVEYLRVPVTDEKAPKERDFAELQARLPGRSPASQARVRLRMPAPPACMHTRAAGMASWIPGGSDAARAGAAGASLACSASARALAQACTHAPPGWRHGYQEEVAPRAQARLGDPPEGAALVFNCQMGRGRTTTGMVIAALLQLRRRMPAGAATLPEHALRARPRPTPNPRATCAQLERASAAPARS